MAPTEVNMEKSSANIVTSSIDTSVSDTQEVMMSLEEAYECEKLTSDPVLRKKLQRKIMKNVLVISVMFFMLFTAYGGLSSLQSSLHKDEGMGTITQSLVYGSMILSCLFVPKLLIGAIGHKWTLPISMSGYILWMAANGYAVWATMTITSIMVGLCAAPLWTAQCTYFTKIAPVYCQITGETTSTVVARFFGIFFCIFQLSNLVGYTISSTILRPPGGPDENNTFSQEEVSMYCGMNDCPWNNITNPGQAKPDDKTLWTMVGTYIAIALLGVVIVCVFVDKLPKYMREDRAKAKKEVTRALVNTALHLKNKYQLLLIPITIYSGLEQGFHSAEWNRSYVSCSLGIWMVGLVGIPGSICNAIMSFSGGYVIKVTGRIPIFTFGFVVHLTIQLVLLFWPLSIEEDYVFYLIGSVWGICDGVWQTQINALYGVIFPDNSEAAFSNYRMWESLGFVLAFAYSNFLCTDVKLYIVMSMLLLGMALYYVVEMMLKKEARKDAEGIDNETETIDGKATKEVNGFSYLSDPIRVSATSDDIVSKGTASSISETEDKVNMVTGAISAAHNNPVIDYTEFDTHL